jgi:hypothetical protein
MKRLALALCLSAPVLAAPPERVTQRSQHWIDEGRATNPDGTVQRDRTIRNWMHWRGKSEKAWRLTDPAVETTAGRPNDWEGDAWDHTHESRRAPLQVYFRNVASADNRGAVVTIRRSRRPASWQRFIALGVNDGVSPTFGPGPRVVRYIGLWPGTTLKYTSGPNVLVQEIIIDNKAIAPAFYEFGMRNNPNHALAIDEVLGTFELFDALGKSVFGTSSITARDSDTNGPNIDGSSPIRLNITDRGTQTAGRARRVLRIRPNVTDMASAVGVVTIR